ncbi:MAG: DUF4124 domain-containing protein [Pseudomonadota bacterium]|nr:DUF4124 domain-containing protein [Pseudomonadota bacterium]
MALASPGLLAEMYKWIDDEGQVQYSQSPPPGRPAETIKPPPKVDSKAAREKLKQQLQDFELRGDKRQEQAEADQKTQEQAGERKAACDTARERLAKLEGKPRILQYAEDGSSKRLTEEERQADIAEARKQVEKHCGP